MASAEAVAAVVEAGGAHVPGADARARGAARRRSRARTGATLGEHAGATIAAGGKRLRPLLVFVAAGPARRAAIAALRAAVAVELVHSATLVHDDVLDAAVLRRGRPTVVASAGRSIATATGDLLFSRAFAELAGGGAVEPVRVLSDASSALVQGELLQREDAWKLQTTRERYLRRCDLKTARLFRAACELGALAGGGDVAPAGRVRRAHRARVPAARRRARRLRPGRAHRQAPRHRPAGRHGHAAADPRARARSGARPSSTCARCARPSRPRACATRSPPRARWRPPARRRWRWSPRRRRICRRCRSRRSRRRWSSWPTASSTGTQLEVFGQDRVGVQRGGEALGLGLHVRLHQAAQVLDERLGAQCPACSSKRSTVAWSYLPTSLHSQFGQRSSTSQCVAEASSQSTG